MTSGSVNGKQFEDAYAEGVQVFVDKYTAFVNDAYSELFHLCLCAFAYPLFHFNSADEEKAKLGIKPSKFVPPAASSAPLNTASLAPLEILAEAANSRTPQPIPYPSPPQYESPAKPVSTGVVLEGGGNAEEIRGEIRGTAESEKAPINVEITPPPAPPLTATASPISPSPSLPLPPSPTVRSKAAGNRRSAPVTLALTRKTRSSALKSDLDQPLNKKDWKTDASAYLSNALKDIGGESIARAFLKFEVALNGIEVCIIYLNAYFFNADLLL